MKSSVHQWQGPGSRAADLPALPFGAIEAEFSQQATLLKADERAYAQHRYRLRAAGGRQVEGLFGEASQTKRLHTGQGEPVELFMTEFRVDQKVTENIEAGIERLLGPLRPKLTPQRAYEQMLELPGEEH